MSETAESDPQPTATPAMSMSTWLTKEFPPLATISVAIVCVVGGVLLFRQGWKQWRTKRVVKA